jgi:MarR family transcriptional regulator, organic hydroperoxide resistance regulator
LPDGLASTITRVRNHRQKAALVRAAETILAQLRRLRRDLLRNPYADAAGHGLTGPQVMVMALLVSKGPLTLTELSRALGMSHSTASGIVDRLEARDLVRRAADPDDRRRTAIAVTDGVRRYVRELEEGPSGRLVRALVAATPVQRSAITHGLSLLCELLDSSQHRRD